MGSSSKQKPWWLFCLQAALIAVAIYGALAWFEANHRFAFDAQQEVRCLPHFAYLIHRGDTNEVQRDEIYAFDSGTAGVPEIYLSRDRLTVKRVMGLPGDWVVVDDAGVWVNGELVGEGFYHAETLEKRPGDFADAYQLVEGEYLMMGDAPESADGRYWGTVPEAALRGRATPLF